MNHLKTSAIRGLFFISHACFHCKRRSMLRPTVCTYILGSPLGRAGAKRLRGREKPSSDEDKGAGVNLNIN